MDFEHIGDRHGQRRRRDVPVQGARPRRADPARRQRALLGEGARQEPRAPATGRMSSSWRSSSASRPAPTGRARSARPPASRRPSTPATPTRAATPSGSASSPRAIATRLGLDTEQVELTRLAGRLHDLGKLAIPEEILRKPGTLDRVRAARARAPSADRLPDAREPRRRSGRRLGAPPSRALGRSRLPGRPARRGRSRSARGSSSSPTPMTR